MSNKETKILYLGPKKPRHKDDLDTSLQRQAPEEVGIEFVPYGGTSDGELLEQLKDVDAVMNQGHQFPEEMFEHMGLNGRCKGMVSLGHGFDTINTEKASENGVILANTASFGTEEVSNHAMMLMLVCARKFVQHNDLVKKGVWTRDQLSPMGHISGQTLGIVGIGDIGRAVGRKAKALGLNIVAFDPFVSSWDAKEYGFETLSDLGELASRSDYISLHCYLNKHTYHMINSDFFSKMKETAYLINCSRGGVVDEEALIQTLNSDGIAGAGLDVFEKEPVDPNNPLLKMGNVAVTSHYASYSEYAFYRAKIQLGEEAVRIATGYMPMSLINPDVARTIPKRERAVDWAIMSKNYRR